MRNKYIFFSFLVGFSLVAVTAQAWTAYWNDTTWMTNGGVIDAEKIAENLNFVHDIFAPGYQAWSSQGTGSGGSAIYNDSGTYKKLMIVGNNSAGGAREVGIWDNLTVNGNVNAIAFLYSSDESLKTDIRTLDNGLDIVKALRGVSFTWKDSGKESVGLIAQEVEQVFPELVSTNSETGLKSVEYGNLVAPLIEAIKAQQQQIEHLQERIQKLEAAE